MEQELKTVGQNKKIMNEGQKIKELINKQVNPTDPCAAKTKILATAQSKSVAVAATTQVYAHATSIHLLPNPLAFNLKI